MGDITVAVVIQNKTVTSILVTETDGDGEEFVKKAKAVADQIVKKQSTRNGSMLRVNPMTSLL